MKKGLVFKLEIGEWYTDSDSSSPNVDDNYLIFRYSGLGKPHFCIRNNKDLSRITSDYVNIADDYFGFFKATDIDILRLFIKDSKRRRIKQNDNSLYKYDKENDYFSTDGLIVYEKGKWIKNYPSPVELYNEAKERWIKAFNTPS